MLQHLGRPTVPRHLLGIKQVSVVGWGVPVPGRPLAASSSLPSLSLSPDHPRSCTLTGEEEGWTQAPRCRTVLHPNSTPACTAGQRWGGAGCGTHGCSFALGSSPGDCCQLCPMSLQRRDARDGAGVCRAPESLRDAQSKGSRVRRVLMALQMPLKLVNSRRCSCRLGQPLLLALYGSHHSHKRVPSPCPPTWHR